MQGQIVKFIPDTGLGYLRVKGRPEDIRFRLADFDPQDRPLVAEGLWAEFDTRVAESGRERAQNMKLIVDEGVSADDCAALFVDEAGDWSSMQTDQDRAIVLTFLPSVKTLNDLVRSHGTLLNAFHASETVRDRSKIFREMRDIVKNLARHQQAGFAVGRIPGARWPAIGEMGATLWAAMIARLLAVYLPFVPGRAWAAIEDRIVTPALWNFYRHEVRARFADACQMLGRPDRAHFDAWLRLCIFAKKLGVLTHQEGQVIAQEERDFELNYLWAPDGSNLEPIEIEKIRCGIALADFIGNVMVSGNSHHAQDARRTLISLVREVDLTEFRL